ncbi:MAG TPA: hypothetical protein PK861_11835, partial [Thermomonas sp.]|nr:hypothetical protein [Thermomonas sp.]
MDFDALDRSLRESAQDFTLDADEKVQLRELGAQLDAPRVRFLRNRAFDIAREAMLATPADTLDVLRWLEQVVKTLDAANEAAPVVSSAYFSPGDTCLRRLRDLMRSCKATLDICVFTIADDRLTEGRLVLGQDIPVRRRIVLLAKKFQLAIGRLDRGDRRR